jgi:hypothetical protein
VANLNSAFYTVTKAIAFCLLMGITTGCATNTTLYSASCRLNDSKCQRNLNAQTLHSIGQEDAALKLLCMDPEYYDSLPDTCTSG